MIFLKKKVSALNFNDPVLAAQTVNQWISNKTKGLIQNVLKPVFLLKFYK